MSGDYIEGLIIGGLLVAACFSMMDGSWGVTLACAILVVLKVVFSIRKGWDNEEDPN